MLTIEESLELLAPLGYTHAQPRRINYAGDPDPQGQLVIARLQRAPFGHIYECPARDTERESLHAAIERETRP